jgi:hypothetical protein
MASARMPEEFFETVAHHLPPERPVGPSVICFRMLYHDVI